MTVALRALGTTGPRGTVLGPCLWWLILIGTLAGFRVSMKTCLWVCLGGGYLEDVTTEGAHTPNMSGPVPRRQVSGWPCK